MLADEINRASPKTQSALLEVMEEGHVTVDGITHDVPRPFMVIATQNPIEQDGTYRLPEAQLDRFLMKTSVGYPDAEATEELLLDAGVRDRAALVDARRDRRRRSPRCAQLADEVYVDRALVALRPPARRGARASMPDVKLGLSARGCLALVRVAKTWAAAARPRPRRARGHRDARRAGPGPPAAARPPRRSSAASRSTSVIGELLARVPAPADRA